jgi:uncharacterized protein
MRRYLRLTVLVALAASLAFGFDFAQFKPEGYVSDFAKVVDARTRAALERYCKAVEDSTGAQFALVTLPTTAGEPVEDVANLLYRRWGIGKEQTDEGLLLLLVIRDRHTRLEVGYGLEPVIPDGYAGSLLREMRPALREQRYGEALAVAAQALGERIASAKGVKIQEAPPPARRAPETSGAPVAPLIVILIALLFVLRGAGRGGRPGGGLLAGMLLGNLLGRGMSGGFHGRSSGGFGGFDSHGGFGGFGGGSSGGGGASGSW